MRARLILLFVLICGALGAMAQRSRALPETETQLPEDTFVFSADTSYIADSLRSDSVFYTRSSVHQLSLLDTLSNDTLLRSLLKPYQFIQNRYIGKMQARRELPTAKEVRLRTHESHAWQFWIILFILGYIAFVRIMNPNNFRVFVLSVFNLKLSEKIWEEQRSIFGFVILQLFAIYIFIAAMFISVQLEFRNIHINSNYFLQFFIIAGVLIVSYALKFMLHTMLGMLLRMKKLAIGFVSNTVSVNNFIALAIFPLCIFIIYNFDPLWATVLSEAVLGMFFISVAYRIVRIFLLSGSFFNFPRIYLILYLCALEVLPWFVIIKFINTLRI